jgi:hypothetical protein
MPEPISESFEITISGKTGAYTVSARGPGVLTQPVPFVWPPPTLPDLDATLMKLETAFELSEDLIRDFGAALYEVLFPEEIDDAYQRLVGQGDPFRLRLIAFPPELARLPWEFLYDAGGGAAGWLALHHKHPFVRSVPNTDIADPLTGKGPLKVQFVGASPKGWTALDIEEDERRLREGLQPLIEKGLVELLDPVMHLTTDVLRDKVRDEPHVLHYSGHGDFDDDTGTGHLVFEDEAGKAARMEGDTLAISLRDRSVRLVVLSACRTAQINESQPFVGVAQQLANAGNLSAVIAMQFPIGDANAVAFNKEFYGALADRFPVDQAITEGRQAIWQRTDISSGGRALVDWATPVLFMLGQSGKLWEAEVSDKDERDEREEEQASGPTVSIGGNVGGDVDVAGGDIVKGNVVQGDKVSGDKVGGDKISVGDISGSKGIAIGRGAQAHVTEGADAAALAKVFTEISARLDALQDMEPTDRELAKETVEEIKEQAEKGDDADEGSLKRRFRTLALMGPEILDVVTATLLGGPVGGIAAVVLNVAQKARDDAGL